MTRGEVAAARFAEGYNCAQAVLMAFADVSGISQADCARAASAFGGGVCGRRALCGAVSGMLMAAGLIRGNGTALPPEEKAAFYARARELMEEFEEKNGTSDCGALLEKSPERPCPRLVGEAVSILETALEGEIQCRA